MIDIRNIKYNSIEFKKFVDEVLTTETDEHILEWYNNPNRLKRYTYISGWFVNGELISVSCCQEYGKHLRVGQIHYTLKRYRKQYPSAMLRCGGFLDYHYNNNIDHYDSVFFSIHTFNKRMRIQSNMMHDRLINTYGENLTELREMITCLRDQTFMHVNQDIFILPGIDFNIEQFRKDVLN